MKGNTAMHFIHKIPCKQKWSIEILIHIYVTYTLRISDLYNLEIMLRELQVFYKCICELYVNYTWNYKWSEYHIRGVYVR